MGAQWVDASKGDRAKPEYRCRLVAKQAKRGERKDLFGATPPLEAKKALFSLLASLPGLPLGIIDVARAYLHVGECMRICRRRITRMGREGGPRRRCTGRETLHRTGSWSTAR